MNLTRTTAPVNEPLTSALVEEKMAFQSGYDSNIITSLISEARIQVEEDTRLSFIDQEWTMTLDCWPSNYNNLIYLPRGPVSSVDSFTYKNSSGDEITLTEDIHFRVSTVGNSTRLSPIGDWPVDIADPDDYPDSIVIVYTSGFGATASAVPNWAKGAMYLDIVHNYNNGEVDVTETYNRRIRKHKDFRDYRVLNR